MTVPGVNLIATAAFLAAIGDIARFEFAAAGRLPRPGPAGPPVRRAARPLGRDHQARLGVGALGAGRGGWSVVNQPGPLRAYYQRIRARRGHGKAIVAAARKLAALFWCLLTAARTTPTSSRR